MKLFILVFLLTFSGLMHASENNKITLGVFPYVGVTQVIKTYSPFKRYLENTLNIRIEILSAKNFNTFVARTSKQKYDIIFTAPHFALKAEEEQNYERLARFSNDIATLVIVPGNSGIKSIKDLSAWTIFTPDSKALVTLIGEELFQKEGLYVNRNINFVSALSHKNVILNVIKRKKVAGLVSSNIYQAFMSKNNASLKVVASSLKMPSAMFMMSAALPGDLKHKITTSVNSFEDSELGSVFFEKLPVKGLQEITDEDMQLLSGYASSLEVAL